MWSRFRHLITLALLPSVGGYATGAVACGPACHGSYVLPLPAGLAVQLVDVATGAAAAAWTAGHTYRVSIVSSSPTFFDGFLFAPLLGAPTTFGVSSVRAGVYAPADGSSKVVSGCSGSVTQITNTKHTTVAVTWTPPVAGTGTVTHFAIIIVYVAPRSQRLARARA